MADPLSKDEELFVRSLADENGRIDPQDVIEAARPDDSIIHDRFTWNKDEAAAAHWRDQACQLIRLVKLEVHIEHRIIRGVAYVSDPERQPFERSRYLDITMAAKNEELAEQVLWNELDRIAAAIRRAQEVAAILGLSKKLGAMLANVSALQTAAERRMAERTKQQQERAAKAERAKKTRSSKPAPGKPPGGKRKRSGGGHAHL